MNGIESLGPEEPFLAKYGNPSHVRGISALFDPEHLLYGKIEIPEDPRPQRICTIGRKNAAMISCYMHHYGPQISNIRRIGGQIDNADPPGRSCVFGLPRRFPGVFSQTVSAIKEDHRKKD